MSVRQSRGYRAFLILGSIACLAGTAYLGWKTFVQTGGAAADRDKAKEAYAKGEANLTANPKEAAVQFDVAAMTAESGLGRLEADKKSGRITDDVLKKMEGELHHLVARSIRDRHYAKSQADGKPLGEQTDSVSGEKYRPYTALTDPADIGKVNQALVRAFDAAPASPEVVKDAARFELSLAGLRWDVLDKLLPAYQAVSPNDHRPYYFQALREFEQQELVDGRWVPTPPAKRSGERVAKAREYLDAAKKNNSPYWRTAHLDADILAWQLDEAKKGKNKSTAEARTRALDGLLFDPDGALDRAARGDRFTSMSMYDLRGVLGVYLLAIRHVIAGDGAIADKAPRVRQVAESAIAAAGQLCEKKEVEGYQPEVGEAVAEVLTTAQAFLATSPDNWKKVMGEADQLFAKYPNATSRPATSLMLANLKRRTAGVDVPNRREHEAEAIKRLEEGLDRAKKDKAKPEELGDFHIALAEAKLLANRPAGEVEPHIAALRGVTHPRTKAVVNFLEGVLAERQGRLDVARKLLEAVTNDREGKNSPLGIQAVSRLANITMAVGDPGAAAGYLAQFAEALRDKQNMDPTTRAWLELAASGRDEVIAKQVRATLAAGLQRVARMAEAEKGQPIPAGVVKPIADSAQALARQLRGPSAADRAARLALAAFHTAVKDYDAADKMIGLLATDYPDSVDVLQASVIRLVAPAAGKKEPEPTAVAKADERIQQFLKLNPASREGKLLWAQWLSRTKRQKDAAAFLRDPKNFPAQDPVVTRMLAGALFSIGERQEAAKLLGGLPADPAVDIALLQAAATKEEMAKGIQSALNKYENNGLIRFYDASVKLTDGKYEEAVKEFKAAAEFAQVKAAATIGLHRALVMYSAADPAKAGPLAHAYITESPDDAGLYLAAALAAYYLEDVGQPADVWGVKKSMYAAVNRWEQAMAKAGEPGPAIGLIKAQFQLLAGNPDLARKEAIRVSGQHPNDVNTLLFLAESYMAGPSPDLAEAKRYLDRANTEAKADNPAPVLLEGTWLEMTKDLDGAAKLYERMMTQFAGNPTPYARRVAVAVAQNKPGDALLWATKWAEKEPDNAVAALEVITRLGVAEPGTDAAAKKADEFVQKQVAAGEEKLKKVQPPPAADDLKKAIDGQRASAQLQAATALFRARRLPEAKARVGEALKALPDLPAGLMLAGDIAMAEQNWDEAERVYRKRLGQEKKDFVAANNLAWLLAEKKNAPAEALKLVTDLRASRGDKPVDARRLPADFLDTIGAVYVKLNDKDKFDDMRETFEGAVKRYPTDPRMHAFLGAAYAARGENSKAMASLDAAIKLASDPAVTDVPEGQKQEAKKLAEATRARFNK